MAAPLTMKAYSPAAYHTAPVVQSSAVEEAQQSAKTVLNAYAESAIQGIGKALSEENSICQSENAAGTGVMSVFISNGVEGKIKPQRIETMQVQPVDVNNKLGLLKDPQRLVYNLLFRACVERIQRSNSLDLILWGIERAVRPAQTVPTSNNFNLTDSRLLKTYVLVTLTKIKKEHAMLIIQSGLKV